MFCVKANPQLNKESFNFNVHGKYPYFTRTTNNNGILGYVDYLDEEHKIQGETIDVGMLGMRFFYMDSDFYAGQFTKTLFPTYSFLNKNNVQYFIALLNKQSGLYKSVLVRDFEKVFYDSKLLLPVKGGKIDFDFIESYMRELEQERIRELEQYLRVTGLDTYALTPREHEILTSHAGGATHLFRIGDLFEKQQLKFKKAKFNKSSDVSKTASDEFDLPLVNAKDGNNGVMYYGRSCDFEYVENSIDIVNDGAVSTGNVYAQPQKTGVLYNAYLIKLKNYTPSPEILLFLAQTIQKIIKPAFGYDNKAGWEKVKKKLILLPIKNGEIDFEYMETYIRAIEKVVIRGVVEWKNKVIEATKSVVNA